MITITNLRKVFPGEDAEVTALQDVNLQVDKGDIFGIIGMSGAGKSTLLRCLCTLEQPTTGSISIAGQNITALTGAPLRERRRKTGVVFQGYNLLMQKTVADNVALPLRFAGADHAYINDQVTRLLSLVGLQDKAGAYPAQLSGGQKQRVAIARALATEPDVLLCDEPTSALDSLTTRTVLEVLQNINRELGVSIVIITHEIAVVRSICNKTAVIDNARFVEVGPTQQVLDNPQNNITKLLLGREGI
ncbi:methionine ABC transporter ATP-binding protein [Ruminococcaceae bacterium OttesenSCG-928-N02]|nr:methionine ABC transporter ATP-binding protein [Ruminococcaceae bacterium OttesenSCG-928-N02]